MKTQSQIEAAEILNLELLYPKKVYTLKFTSNQGVEIQQLVKE